MLEILSIDDYMGGQIDFLADIHEGHVGPSVANFKRYCPRVCEYLRDLMRDKKCIFIDVGSHNGYFSCLAARWMRAGSIHAIEPNKQVSKILTKNLHDHGGNFNLNRVARFHWNFVATDEPGNYAEAQVVSQSERTTYLRDEKGSHSGCRIDKELLPFFHDCDAVIVKVNVNGSEEKVLNGLFEVRDCVDYVVIRKQEVEFFEHGIREAMSYDEFTYDSLDNNHILMRRLTRGN